MWIWKVENGVAGFVCMLGCVNVLMKLDCVIFCIIVNEEGIGGCL